MFTLSYLLSHGIKKGFGERTFRHVCNVLILLKLYFRVSPSILFFWLIDRIRPRVSSRIIKFKRRHFVYGAYNLDFVHSYKHACRFLYKASKMRVGLGPMLSLFVEIVMSLYGKSPTLQLRRELHAKAFTTIHFSRKNKGGHLLWHLLFGRYYINIRSYWFSLASTKWRLIKKTPRQLLEHWKESEYRRIRQLHLRRRIFEKAYRAMRKWLRFGKEQRFYFFDKQMLRGMLHWFRLTWSILLFQRVLKLIEHSLYVELFDSELFLNSFISKELRGLSLQLGLDFRTVLNMQNDKFILKLIVLMVSYRLSELKARMEKILTYYMKLKQKAAREAYRMRADASVILYKTRNVEAFDLTDVEAEYELDYRHDLHEDKKYLLPPFTFVEDRDFFEEEKNIARQKRIEQFKALHVEAVNFKRYKSLRTILTESSRHCWSRDAQMRKFALDFWHFEREYHAPKIRKFRKMQQLANAFVYKPGVQYSARLVKFHRRFDRKALRNLISSFYEYPFRNRIIYKFFSTKRNEELAENEWFALRQQYFIKITEKHLKNVKGNKLNFFGQPLVNLGWDLQLKYQRKVCSWHRDRSYITKVCIPFLNNSRKDVDWEKILDAFLNRKETVVDPFSLGSFSGLWHDMTRNSVALEKETLKAFVERNKLLFKILYPNQAKHINETATNQNKDTSKNIYDKSDARFPGAISHTSRNKKYTKGASENIYNKSNAIFPGTRSHISRDKKYSKGK